MVLSKGALSKEIEFQSAMQKRLQVARGETPADTVIRGAKWLDVFTGCWVEGDVALFDGVIVGTKESYEAKQIIDGAGTYLVPGFIDAHVHIESSLMTPGRFATAVLPRGTTTVIWDPHEIANVKGAQGIEWALESTDNLPLSVFVMIPSCVPSTSESLKLESGGASLKARDLAPFINHPRVLGLAEMMNWPGLIQGDGEVLEKLDLFQYKKRDGHCPGLSGRNLNAYGVAGIHTCHESTTLEEAQEKLQKGIHVLIREGSCAKDTDALIPLLNAFTSATLGYCSDDRNPLDIEESGHLDAIINKALQKGYSPIEVFRASSYAAAKIFHLEDRGAVAPGYRADLVSVTTVAGGDDFSKGIRVESVWVGGETKWEIPVFSSRSMSIGQNLDVRSPQGGHEILSEDFAIKTEGAGTAKVRVIGVRPGQIVTDEVITTCPVSNGELDLASVRGINKIAVIERHRAKGTMSTALVQGFNLERGAIATSINHDCHNIIVTGSTAALMAKAVQVLRDLDGGIVVVGDDGESTSLRLPIGGLMTEDDPDQVAQALRQLKQHANKIGCTLEEPFLQLSFLALPVIPSLKITDLGLVDGRSFKMVPVVVA